MGERGPVPKHANQRRRRNKTAAPTTAAAARKVAIPPVDRTWHRVAKLWYRSLRASGQSAFYEPSDWAAAYLVAENMSRDLEPRFVGISEASGEPIFVEAPIRGASMSAYLKAMTNLCVTEADRRRARILLLTEGDLDRPPADGGKAPSSPSRLADLDEYRRRVAN